LHALIEIIYFIFSNQYSHIETKTKQKEIFFSVHKQKERKNNV